jgi:hypothetical protein
MMCIVQILDWNVKAMSNTSRSFATYSIDEALGSAPVLAQLRDRLALSDRCFSHILPLIPITMRSRVKAGPIEERQWCLLVGSAAASTKLRQLLPTIQASLTQQGFEVSEIRIKVQTAGQ